MMSKCLPKGELQSILHACTAKAYCMLALPTRHGIQIRLQLTFSHSSGLLLNTSVQEAENLQEVFGWFLMLLLYVYLLRHIQIRLLMPYTVNKFCWHATEAQA